MGVMPYNIRQCRGKGREVTFPLPLWVGHRPSNQQIG